MSTERNPRKKMLRYIQFLKQNSEILDVEKRIQTVTLFPGVLKGVTGV